MNLPTKPEKNATAPCEMKNSFTWSKLYCFAKKWMTLNTAGCYVVAYINLEFRTSSINTTPHSSTSFLSLICRVICHIVLAISHVSTGRWCNTWNFDTWFLRYGSGNTHPQTDEQIYRKCKFDQGFFCLSQYVLQPPKKVKASHSRYRALGPELILVYRQSASRWL